MQIKNTYSSLYLQRRDLEKRIESCKNQIKMLKTLKSQINSQIRQHLKKEALKSIKGYEVDRTIINCHHQSN